MNLYKRGRTPFYHVTNERSVTSLDSDVRGQLHKEYADNAARIEAANDLSVSAGRDINTIGSTLQAGRDLALNAGIKRGRTPLFLVAE